MLVTEVGIDTAANEVHPPKAHFPMLVTDSGMVTLRTVVLSTPHSAQESARICPPPTFTVWIPPHNGGRPLWNVEVTVCIDTRHLPFLLCV